VPGASVPRERPATRPATNEPIPFHLKARVVSTVSKLMS